MISREAVSRWANQHRRWILAGPAVAFIVLLLVVPLLWTLWMSITNAEGSVRREYSVVGLKNYLEVLTDVARFWPAVGRTVLFTGAALVLEVLFGVIVALLLWKPFRGQTVVRIAILLPLVATPVAVGMMFRLILEPNIGLANQVLGWLGIAPWPWLSGPATALPTLVLIDAWQWTSMVTLIVLAGLVSLPDEPDEAARVDGASYLQRLWFVTLPLLRPTIVAAAVLRGIDAVKTFDIIYATKGRGGGSFHEAETLNIYAYSLTFDYNRYAVAATVLVLFFAMIVALVRLGAGRRRGLDL